MQTTDLEMSKDLSEAVFNPRASSLFQEHNLSGQRDRARKD